MGPRSVASRLARPNAWPARERLWEARRSAQPITHTKELTCRKDECEPWLVW